MMVVSSTTISCAPAIITRIHQCARVTPVSGGCSTDAVSTTGSDAARTPVIATPVRASDPAGRPSALGETLPSHLHTPLYLFRIVVFTVGMTRGMVRDRLSSAILEAAATVLSEQGQAASMSDVAEAAGIGRATLYRYFASRDDLLRALSAAAVDEANARLLDGDLESVPVPEALARVARALVACGVKFAVIADEPQFLDREDLTRRVGTLVQAVLQRGIDDGTLRGDLPIDTLYQLWGGLLMGASRSMGPLDNSIERAGAAVSSLFLDGASRQQRQHPPVAPTPVA